MTKRTKLLLCLGGAALLALALPLAFSPGHLMALAMGIGLAATTIVELPRLSDIVLWEDGRDIEITRGVVMIASGAKHVRGEVMGKVSVGAATVANNGAGAAGANTGAGTLTMDAGTPIRLNAITGVYLVKILAVGRMEVVDPKGSSLGEMEYAAGAAITWDDQIKFALADDAATHFAAGDGFTVTVAAGSGKYAQLAPAAVDGTQNAAAVLLYAADATSADAQAVALIPGQGHAVLKANGLVWPVGITDPQKAAAIAQLLALGVQVRTDYGV